MRRAESSSPTTHAVGETTRNLSESMCIPYVKGVSERIRREMNKIGITVRFSRGRSLQDILCRGKFRNKDILDAHGVIYTQGCRDCDAVYVGETGRKARVRKAEHDKCLSNCDVKSAIAQHALELDHRPDKESFRIVLKEKNWFRRRVKESLMISSLKNFNRDSGLELKGKWQGVMKKFGVRFS